MKKLGFTLAELIVTLSIVGIASALVVPALSDLMPDKNKVKVLRYNSMLGESLNEIFSDDNLYHPYTNHNDGKYSLSCIGRGCVANFDLELKKRLKLSGTKSSDGSSWAFSESGDNIYIVVNTDEGKKNSYYPSGVSEPKKAKSFRFKIDMYGEFSPADPLTEAYLRNPLNMNDRKTDYAWAKANKDKKY